ncbi:hypothetical protein JTE90_010571 [Oedothorax gibbosus]|uniref:Peptidase M3A/M3B catalytic domain-containing protein n=1 Tax=Oedothorax gibbosus TaxID=931172 RepID=A0AAV6UFH9_9ARAC|nr:hypothetical protein JTE90_010571 [Oedothorax gibbosus]
MPVKGMSENWSCKIAPAELLSKTTELTQKFREVYDTVAAVPDNEVSYKTILKTLIDAENKYTSKRFPLATMKHFVTDSALRDASTEADKILQAFDVELSMRRDVFQKLTVLEKKNEDLQPEEERLLKRYIVYGKRNGLHLPEEFQGEIKSLKTKIKDLCIQFCKNVNDESTILEFSEEELFGMPADFFGGLKKLDSGKYQVTLKYPDYIPIMKKCRKPETRKSLYIAFQSRCSKENYPLLQEIVQMRHKLANMLGYPNHASYATELLMSKSAETVGTFLSELLEKLRPLWAKEKEYLLELKEKECKELGIPFDGKMNPYDLAFYTSLVESTKYAVDHQKLKEYFPMPVVTEGLLNIYQGLLGLKFNEIKEVELWHEDVKMYSVEDLSTGELLGYFFLDLHPREGKYGHACVSELKPGCLLPDGTRQEAVAAMLANFTKPQKDKPSLLDHDEVVTYFHEFGHLMHYICSQVDIAHFCGFAVERDFVEAPSQMLENWCWETDPLKKMSMHYENDHEIPEMLLNALTKSRMANTAYQNLVQINYALFDFRIHSSPECDIKKAFSDTYKEVLDLETLEQTNTPCSFMHICDEYDAQYYSYLWSEVYSMDMFYTRFKDGKVLDPQVGMDYRKKILKPGGSKDAMDLLVDFLGRQPTQEAFLCSKGLKI